MRTIKPQTIIALTVFSILLLPAMSYAAEYSPLPDSVAIGKAAKASVPFDIDSLKSGWRERINAIKADGVLPIIDIESSFNPGSVDAQDYAKDMDNNGIALTAFSPQVGIKKFKKKGALWHEGARRAVGADPSRFIPVSTAGNYPAWTGKPDNFLDKTIEKVEGEGYPMMGEFEFRHYMSPRQYKRDETYRDITIPVDSDVGHKLFAFSEKTGISFQIHYEVEDELLGPLETMLEKYPRAKVIWAHLGQVRYSDRSKKYGPAYVRSLIEKYPNIYFDLAFGDADSVYPGSDEYHSRVWDQKNGGVKKAWVQLIADHPYRFLAALDIGGDRVDRVTRYSKSLRNFISHLPDGVQAIVAYKAAWKLLFNEDI